MDGPPLFCLPSTVTWALPGPVSPEGEQCEVLGALSAPGETILKKLQCSLCCFLLFISSHSIHVCTHCVALKNSIFLLPTFLCAFPRKSCAGTGHVCALGEGWRYYLSLTSEEYRALKGYVTGSRSHNKIKNYN